jgi:hypothetical protein
MNAEYWSPRSKAAHRRELWQCCQDHLRMTDLLVKVVTPRQLVDLLDTNLCFSSSRDAYGTYKQCRRRTKADK